MFLRSRSVVFYTLIFYHLILSRLTWAEDGVTNNYCNISSCGTSPHTLCTYPNDGPSKNCNNYIAAPLTKDEISRLVKWHNELRKKVADGLETRGSNGPQPPASNMREMVWDEEVARIAQRWADQCASAHDECRDTVKYTCGQNIATYWSSAAINITLEKLVDEWYVEVNHFDKENVAKYQFSAEYGHYSQVLWAESHELGCGVARYFDTQLQMNALQLICNYAPAGNYIGNSVYKEGKAASACPSSVSKNIPSLCA